MTKGRVHLMKSDESWPAFVARAYLQGVCVGAVLGALLFAAGLALSLRYCSQ